jgi:hypothetical protein
MIHYDLRCGGGHEFDGWFRSSAAFDQQSALGLLDCPVCASTDVTRALMAPRVRRAVASPAQGKPARAKQETAAEQAGERAAMAVSGLPAIPDQMRAVLQRIRAEVEQNCDYVGPRFADEARAMHEGLTPARPIYGEATEDQAETLAEEGIDIARIPWVPRSDA